MTAGPSLRPLVGYLQQLAVTSAQDQASDRQLLEHFARDGNEDAFRTLVYRHGSLVLGVCRRALPCLEDAEDCFQAAFLLLARKANAIRWQESVAGWLHDVATRLAAELRVREARRRRRERQAAERADEERPRISEVGAAIDEELQRLPLRCRAPLLLCYLQERTHDEAATQLGLSLRTLERRLRTGRALLRDRLVRRGLTVSAALLAWQMTQETIAAVPLDLGVSISQAAAAFGKGIVSAMVPFRAQALARQVLRGWFWARVRMVAAVLTATGLLVLGGSAWIPASTNDGPSPEAQAPAAPAEPAPPIALQEAGTAMAVQEGLRWLVHQQMPAGGWKLDAATPNDVAATAFGLLPLLGAGADLPAGKRFEPHDASVKRGLKALASMQKEDGSFPGGMYAHGLATAALCEGYRLTGDAALKQPAQRAIDTIVRAQHTGGGWRYAPGQEGDTSVTGWQVLALDRGRAAGLDVPKATLRQASAFLDSVSFDDGAGYGYVASGSGSLAMTASGLHSRFVLGWAPRQEAALKGAARLSAMPPSPTLANCYYYYFATQAMRRIGGAQWDFWESRMARLLMDRQAQTGEDRGSWPTTGDAHAAAGGRLMATSLALLALEPCGQLTAPAGKKADRFKDWDGLQRQDREAAADWDALLSRDLAIVRGAVDRLAASPAHVVPFFRELLGPPPVPDAKRLDRLIHDLDNDDFDIRLSAFVELQKLGEPAAPALRRALKTARSLETRRRLEQLIDQLDSPTSSRRLRQLRAIQILELCGTPQARALLEAMVREQPETPLAQAAREALDRQMHRRQNP
jgi:RNA polymerase sigma factor (sigma-70 family)